MNDITHSGLPESPAKSSLTTYGLRMMMSRAAVAVVTIAALMGGSAHASQEAGVTDEPPQTCSADCGVGMVRAYPREWSDRQWLVVGIAWRDRVRYPHQELWLQSMRSGGWTTVARAESGADGRAVFVVSSSSGRPQNLWRIRYPGDAATLYDDSEPFSIPAS